MHRGPVVGDVVDVPQQREQVVRREHRVATRLGHAVLAKRLHVRIGAHEHAEVPETLLDGSDRIADRLRIAVLTRGVVVVRPVGLADDPRLRQEGAQRRLHAERPGSGTAGAVRRGEGLVHVDVDAVEPEVSRSRDPEQRVHVCAIAIDETAHRVDRRTDLADALLEQPEGVRVGEHESRDVGTERRLQRVEVDVTSRVGLHRGDLVSAHRR